MRSFLVPFALTGLPLFVSCGRSAEPGAGGQDTSANSLSMHFDDVACEAACGQCQFDLPGEGCALALRIGEQAWFVDGVGIDEHGDAHADDGFCNAIRRAVVSGDVKDERFVATSFQLQPAGG